MEVEDEITYLIREYGGVLNRQNKHEVYKFPDGRVFVLSGTPSTRQSALNSLTMLRRFLGVKRDINKNPERLEKKGVTKPAYRVDQPPARVADFREQLKGVKTVLQVQEQARQDHLRQLMVVVVTCDHSPRVMGDLTYWCSLCRKRFCRKCWRPHFALRHPGFLEIKKGLYARDGVSM